MLTKYKIKSKFQIAFILLIIICVASIISFSLSTKLDNDTEVEFNSELIYYLDITYDGVDKYGIESNDSTLSRITSDYIYIEDKLPDGLIFNGFVTTEDKTFGAVSRDDYNSVCSGSVIDDSTGENKERYFIWKDWNNLDITTYSAPWGSFIYADEIDIVPTREGYTFEGWSTPTFDENLNVIYTAIYKGESANYTVEWYDTEGSFLKAPETRSSTIGGKVSVTNSDKIINGYTFDTNNPNNIESIILSPTNNKLKLYFRYSDQVVNNNYINTIRLVDNEEYTYNFHGLHYNEKTRTVSFKVKNLQAGCKLTIGIKTITPSKVDDPSTEQIELRRDFYNFGISNEKDSTKLSNTVHAWMGSDKVALYNVKYEYTGDIPPIAPNPPKLTSYSSKSNVGVAINPIVEGYHFTGWKTEDVELFNNSFIMPSKNVTFKGSFEKLDKYNVIYEIEGNTPEGYILPSEKSYYIDSFVKLDSLNKGDVFNGYRFLGWNSKDVIINEDQTFIMPEKNVTITGQFEPVTYKVEYRFYDTILPPNSTSLLPETEYYRPGSEVTLKYPLEAEGYSFLGWYKESKFTMPESDVIIYGEWKIQNGVFTPSIEKEIINKQDYYRPGDIVYYNIKVTNNADYPIKDVIVEEKNDRTEFYINALGCLADSINICQTSYIVKTANLVEIPSLASHTSVDVLARYIVSDNDKGIIENEVQIIGALADNYYDLDTKKEYKDTASINIQSHLKICKEINSTDPKIFQFHISDNESYDSWINLSNNECTTIYLKPNSYNITEVIPQEYTLKEITLATEDNIRPISNNDLIDIEFNHNYQITFKNSYRKKGFYHSDGRIENKVKNEKTQIYIDIPDYYKEYDGEDNYEMTYFINDEEYESLFEIIPPEGPFINAGTYEISPKIIWKNPIDESKYELHINKGELIINKRKVTIRSGTSTKEYDGIPLINKDCEIVSGSFVAKDTYKCNVIGSQIDVGESSNIFSITFDDIIVEPNYNIIKINGTLTVTEALPRFTIIYRDGLDGRVFGDQTSYSVKEGLSTPPFYGSTERAGYTFMGWAPTINPKVSSSDANENGEIIYTATWFKN